MSLSPASSAAAAEPETADMPPPRTRPHQPMRKLIHQMTRFRAALRLMHHIHPLTVIVQSDAAQAQADPDAAQATFEETLNPAEIVERLCDAPVTLRARHWLCHIDVGDLEWTVRDLEGILEEMREEGDTRMRGAHALGCTPGHRFVVESRKRRWSNGFEVGE